MKKKALIFNILLVVFEVVGLTWSMINKHGLISFKFYTNLSNVLALIAGILFIVRYYFFKNNIFSKICDYVKIISTIGLTVTFLVVLFVLGPNGAKTNGLNGYLDYLFPNGLLFLHVLCPIVIVISFTCFENHKNFNNILWYLVSAVYTFIYGIIIITLVYFTNISAPYFFLNSKTMGYWPTFGYGMLFVVASSLIAYVLVLINRKVVKD